MPIDSHICFQKSFFHLVSLSEITCRGIPNFDMICLKNNLAVSFLLIVVWHGMKIPYFVNLSTTTKILSYPFDSESSGIKSMDTTSNGCVGIGIELSSPAGA